MRLDFYFARARHAQDEARRCVTPAGRALWLEISHQYHDLAGYAERAHDDEVYRPPFIPANRSAGRC